MKVKHANAMLLATVVLAKWWAFRFEKMLSLIKGRKKLMCLHNTVKMSDCTSVQFSDVTNSTPFVVDELLLMIIVRKIKHQTRSSSWLGFKIGWHDFNSVFV